MSGNRALPALALAVALFSRCGPSEKRRGGEETRGLGETAAKPEPPAPAVPGVFADPGEDAPISDLAVDATSHHLVAVSRKARTIGATPIGSSFWSWRTKLTQPPALVAVHPISGEGFLIWRSESGAGVVRFRPATGETLGALDLSLAPGDLFRAAAFDTEQNRLFLATERGILCLDLESHRLLPARPGTAMLPFVQPLDLAIDPRRALAVIPHAGVVVALLDVEGWGQYGLGTPAVEIPMEAPHAGAPSAAAVDSERGRAYVLDGHEWAEIDLDGRQIARWVAFDPERDFTGGRIAVAASCSLLYLACNDLVEVNLENGQWEPIVPLGQCPAPVAHSASVGVLFTIHDGQIYSSHHRCGPE